MNVPFLQDTTFTGLISTKSHGTSQEWSQAYSLIQTNSANWEESADILPTVTSYLSTNNILVSTLNTRGPLLSADIDLFDIFLTSETDSQTLSYIPSSYSLSISNGNTVNLSSINTTFANNSGKYEEVYNVVTITSGDWNEAYDISTAYSTASSSFATNTTLESVSSLLTPLTLTNNLTSQLVLNADFDSYKTSVTNVTATLLPTTIYQNASGNWQNTFTNVQTNSGSYATTSYVGNNFLSLNGGLVQGPVQINNNLTVFGNLTASGTTTFANTIFTTTTSLSVVHFGSGPALYVGNYGNDHIATFVDLQNDLEMMHIGGLSSLFPNVGIKTGAPNKDFTVNGEISATGTIWNSEGNSIQWNKAYDIGTAYQTISSTFLTTETDSQTLTFTQSSTQLSITNGNTVSLSALDDKEFATAMAIVLS
jgi:hypothetical protein